MFSQLKSKSQQFYTYYIFHLYYLANTTVILPANPGFYTRPANIEELVDGIVQRILDQIGLEDVVVHKRWREGTVRRRQATRKESPHSS